MVLDLGVCPCCVPTIALALATAGFVVLMTARLVVGGSRGLLGRCLRWTSNLLGLVIFAAALGLTLLNSNATLRQRAFAKLCAALSKEPAMLPPRCERLGLGSELGGLAVIEFGPGPGTNFACFTESPPARWTGVEPNAFFADAQDSAAAAANLTLPRDVAWLRGEDVDVDAASYDAAILTHVLCSVDDPAAVLRQAARALKPGGKMYVMEHVEAEPGTADRALQVAFAPLFEIVANGCKFRNTAAILRAEAPRHFTGLSIEEFRAPLPIPFLRPHVIATATRSA